MNVELSVFGVEDQFERKQDCFGSYHKYWVEIVKYSPNAIIIKNKTQHILSCQKLIPRNCHTFHRKSSTIQVDRRRRRRRNPKTELIKLQILYIFQGLFWIKSPRSLLIIYNQGKLLFDHVNLSTVCDINMSNIVC